MSNRNGKKEITLLMAKAKDISVEQGLKFIEFEHMILASLKMEEPNEFKKYAGEKLTAEKHDGLISELYGLANRRMKRDADSVNPDVETLVPVLKDVVGQHLRRYLEIDPTKSSDREGKIYNTNTYELLKDIYESEISPDVNTILNEYGIEFMGEGETHRPITPNQNPTQHNIPIEFIYQEYETGENIVDPTKKINKMKSSVLEQFGINLTEKANKGQIDPVIGRDVEIERIAQILSRRKKNNPLLLGEAGTGKTAVVEGLALLINNEKCPRILRDKQIFTLDLTSLVSGTKYRGQFEERIKELITELKDKPDVITFIDELHTIVGAGNASGSLDVSNILKPALASGEIQCIGATTLDEYREVIEKDSALDRRFQRVMIDEPSAEDTLKILMNIKTTYEEFHGVKYTDEAIKQIVILSERYITQRNFPDKAIDVLDEVASRARVNIQTPQEILDLEEELSNVKKQKIQAVMAQQYEEAAKLRDSEKTLEEQIAKAIKKHNQKRDFITIDKNDINKLISQLTKIPVTDLTVDETKKLINIDKDLANSVIGQDEAISSVAKSIRRSRVGVKNKTTPIASFMFVGSSGVGKTELAKTLAKKVFGSESNLIRFDMSEYQEGHTVSKLIGAAPGYVGYEKGGDLTEKIKNNPYCVILFDEVEKAHPNIFNLLLGIMDEGRATDNVGRTVDFKNTIIILTSNVGVKQSLEGGAIGFGTDSENDVHRNRILEKELKKKFAPEFINRLDEIIYFKNLTKEAIKGICKLRVNELAERLKENNWELHVTDSVIDLIAKEGYNPDFGGRELNRTIQTMLEDSISDEILLCGSPDNAKIKVTVEKGKIKVKVN